VQQAIMTSHIDNHIHRAALLAMEHPLCIWLEALLQMILGRSGLLHPCIHYRQINLLN
jgi:hypothetical protein